MALTQRRLPSSFLDEDQPNLTPLIDCVFLLLIFFMVTTVFIHTKGLDVDLPAPTEATERQERKDINVTISETGRVQVGGEDVTVDQLVPHLQQAMREANNENITIQADESCAQKYVVAVVDAAKGAGVSGIAFVKEEGGA